VKLVPRTQLSILGTGPSPEQAVGFLVCTESASTMNPQSTAAKETKAQQAERLKAAKNPWQAIEELKRYARLGYESIPEKWTKTYLRWWAFIHRVTAQEPWAAAAAKANPRRTLC
jgi:hypothetical protein